MHSCWVVRLLVVLEIVALGGCSTLLGFGEPSSPPPQPAAAATYVPPSVVSSFSSQDEVREKAHRRRLRDRTL